jgi:hypothetical protein
VAGAIIDRLVHHAEVVAEHFTPAAERFVGGD